jgi:hypothetical protein
MFNANWIKEAEDYDRRRLGCCCARAASPHAAAAAAGGVHALGEISMAAYFRRLLR